MNSSRVAHQNGAAPTSFGTNLFMRASLRACAGGVVSEEQKVLLEASGWRAGARPFLSI